MPRFRATTEDLQAAPPPEVLQQIGVAWERARELFDSEIQLHFRVNEEIGSVWAELRAADGTVVERLSASEALALACGVAMPEQLAAAA